MVYYLLLLGFIAFLNPCRAEIIPNAITKDTYLSGGGAASQPNYNFGLQTGIGIGNSTFAGVYWAAIYEGLFGLNLSFPIPSGKAIYSAHLVLFVVGSDTDQPNLLLTQVSNDWIETNVTYNTVPDFVANIGNLTAGNICFLR